MSYIPSGSGYRNFLHYAQLINYQFETFARYDYGSDVANYNVYNYPNPPSYDLSQLGFPIAIFAGTLDQMVSL